jgi:hypothetical protein
MEPMYSSRVGLAFFRSGCWPVGLAAAKIGVDRTGSMAKVVLKYDSKACLYDE